MLLGFPFSSQLLVFVFFLSCLCRRRVGACWNVSTVDILGGFIKGSVGRIIVRSGGSHKGLVIRWAIFVV